MPLGRVLSETELEGGVFSSWEVGLTSVLIVLLAAVATSVGIGGGGLFVPVNLFVMKTGIKGAVPISKATILGGAVGKFVSTSRERHPNADRPSIDYKLATSMLAWELLGTIFGVLFNTIFPDLLIVILLVLILGYSSMKTFKKAKRLFKAETEENKTKTASAAPIKKSNAESAGERNTALQQQQEETKRETPTAIIQEKNEGKTRDPNSPLSVSLQMAKDEQSQKDDLQAELAREARPWPWSGPAMALMTAFIALYSLAKKGELGHLPACSAGYWILYFIPCLFFPLIGLAIGHQLHKDHRRKQQVGFNFLKGDIQWTRQTLSQLPLVGWAAGAAASLVGIGGGMIIVPLFLNMDILPQVAANTNALMILFVAVSSVVQYSVLGTLPWDYALWFMFLGFLGAQLGSHFIKHLLARSGRPSAMAFILAGFIACCVAAMLVSGVLEVASTPGEEVFRFSKDDLCSGSH